jgi:formate dehydrogenase subunit gamma
MEGSPMKAFSDWLGRASGALMLLLAVTLAAPVSAQQPASVNPTAAAAREQQLLDALRPGGTTISGRVSIPDTKSADLIKPSGQEWRHFHQVTLPWLGAIAIVGMVVLLAGFRATRGRVMISKGRSGQTITRFAGLDRFAHWLTAGSFLVLAVTGLNITFGKFVLLPVIGPDAFTAFSQLGKYIHNYLAFPFMLGILLMFGLWVKDNIPNKGDIAWFKAGGGLIGDQHPEAARFNGGQKMIFWTTIISGVALSVSGILLLFPYVAGTYGNWQLSQVVHGLVGVLTIAVILAHVYIGSIGMEGAFDAMGTGEVDLNWAREHHALWVKQHMDDIHERAPKAVPAE